MSEDQKRGYKSLVLNKKAIVVVVAALAVTFTLTASAFMDDNTSARKYEKNQALSGANACGDGELPLNILCQNMASEIQGDENAVGVTSAQQGGVIAEEPYENLVDEVSMQGAIDDNRNQISDMRKSSVLDSIGGSSNTAEPGLAMVTPTAVDDKQIEATQLGMSKAADFNTVP